MCSLDVWNSWQMPFETFGKWLVATGVMLLAVGAGLWAAARFGLPLGRMPGDLRVEGRDFSFHLPLATCIVASIVLTLIVNLFWRIFHR